MLILIVSANPLFKEVINEIVTQVQAEIIELSFEEARNRICEIKPDIIIIDEGIKPPHFESLLAEARNLEKTRTIVINPLQNDIVLLDSRRKTLQNVDDLMEIIAKREPDLPPDVPTE
jgi:chemotaxis response regulator CheB